MNARNARVLVSLAYINMNEPQISRSDFDKHIKWATSIVESWPDWKRNVLRRSLEPMRETAREPVDNFISDENKDQTD